jgi:Fur family transcriptional regulator, ferric uptake regulator
MVTTELDAQLRARGYRVTRPRRAVWEVLTASPGHLTVDEIAVRIDADGGGVDTASIYRTLALFEELELVRTTRLGGSDAGHWELAHPDEHFHLVCVECGGVDHHIGSLVAQIAEHLDRDHDFEARDVDLVVTGRCADCRQR